MSRNVIREMKAVFTEYGIPDVLVTYNCPQFASAEFAVFVQIHHIITVPPTVQWKGKNTVKTVIRQFTKFKESGQSEFLALLDWCNTLSEGIDISPAQCLMRCCCKTLLPIAGTLLRPRYSTKQEHVLLLEISSASSSTMMATPNYCTQLNLEKLSTWSCLVS